MKLSCLVCGVNEGLSVDIKKVEEKMDKKQRCLAVLFVDAKQGENPGVLEAPWERRCCVSVVQTWSGSAWTARCCTLNPSTVGSVVQGISVFLHVPHKCELLLERSGTSHTLWLVVKLGFACFQASRGNVGIVFSSLRSNGQGETRRWPTEPSFMTPCCAHCGSALGDTTQLISE